MGLFNFEIINQVKPDLIQRVKDKEIDGFIYQGLLNESELSAIKSSLQEIPKSDWMDTPSGIIFPQPFAVITDEDELLNRYFKVLGRLEDSAHTHQSLRKLFKTLQSYIEAVGANFQVKVPTNKTKNKTVVPGTFRYLYPNRGGLYVHSGNYFQDQSMQFYEQISESITLEDQLSYFIVLENADEGGELTLYDLFWEDAKYKDDALNNEYVLSDQNEKIFIDSLKKEEYRPAAGDVLIFSGGRIWHRVEEISGNTSRLTLGGFINFSKDNEFLYYWS